MKKILMLLEAASTVVIALAVVIGMSCGLGILLMPHANAVQIPPQRQVDFEETVKIEPHVVAEPIRPKLLETESTQEYTEDDIFCLAAVIYQEAGGDACSDDNRYYVADVVLNRVEDPRFPNSIREVLEDAPGGYMQYGRFSVTGVCFPERANSEYEKHAVERAYRIAEDVLVGGNHSELYGQGYVYQAEFVQGNEGFWLEGTYFGK